MPAEGEERWTIRVCRHGEVVTFGINGRPRHIWDPGGGNCDDNSTLTCWVEVVRASRFEEVQAELEELREDAEEARKVRGALSLAAPAGYAVAHVKEWMGRAERAEADVANLRAEARGHEAAEESWAFQKRTLVADLERAQAKIRRLNDEWENLEAAAGYDVEALAEARERGEDG